MDSNQLPESQPDMDRSKIFLLLGRLSISLGCYQPNFENFLAVFEPQQTRADIELSDIQKHFKYLQSTKDPQAKALHHLRYKLFLHLYGMLVKLEMNDKIRNKYLILCFKLFGVDRPKKLKLKEALLYQEAYIDRLTQLIQRLIHVNVIEMQTSQLTSRINELYAMHLQAKSNQSLALKIRKVGCAHPDSNAKEYCCDLRGLRWEQEHKSIQNMPMRCSLLGCANLEDTVKEYSFQLKGLRGELERKTIRCLLVKIRIIGVAYIVDYAKEYSFQLKGFRWEKYHRSIQNLPIKIAILGYACQENYAKQYNIDLKGLRWERELKLAPSLPEQREIEEESSIEEIDMLRDEERCQEIVYIVDWEMRQLILKAYAQLSICDSEASFRIQTSSLSSSERSCETLHLFDQQSMYSLPDVHLESVVEEAQLAVLSPRFHHQRHIIAAPRAIIQLFRCNPSYRCCPCHPDAPNFFEQLAQFSEITGLAGKDCPLDAVDIRARIELTMRQIMYEPLWRPELCIREMAKIQLHQLLTREEQRAYEKLRLQHRDPGVSIDLSPEERQRDVLHGMLGCECLQLKPSALKCRLLLRSPLHQQSISESFLLLALGQVGYYYKTLQQQLLRLSQLGESGMVLALCLREELLVLYRFHQEQQLLPERLIRLYLQTRSLQLRFQWLLQLCQGLTRKTPLLRTLHQQLGQGYADYDELLQLWLLKVTQPLLERISKWLLKGKLPKSEHKDFFIVVQPEMDSSLYWTSHFELIVELLPPFLDRHLAQQLLSVGRGQHYARKFLEIELSHSLREEQLQQQLSEACEQSYRELNQQPLNELIFNLKQKTSKLLLMQLQEWSPTPLEILSKLHQYLLLTDVDFVRELMELLEPALEQPVRCFDVQQLNNMLEQMLGKHNEQLYVDQAKREGKLCWSHFLLSWKLPSRWEALIGHRLEQYSYCFVGLWQLHHADYVLSERIQRQQLHFQERIGLDPSEDALLVGERFDQFIDKLLKFMSTLRRNFLHDVLGSAFESLYIACRITKSLDELLDLHAEYLNGIESGILQTKLGSKSLQCLANLYNIIFQLDTEQQQFLSLCQLINKSKDSADLNEFHWFCLNTCDALNELDKQFQLALVNFLLALYSAGGKQFVSLARKLDHNRYYTKKFKQLERVNTFRFQRKFQLLKDN